MIKSRNPDVIGWYEFAEKAADSNAWDEEQLTKFATTMCQALTLGKLKARDTHGFEISPPPDLPFFPSTVYVDPKEAVLFMESEGPFRWGQKKKAIKPWDRQQEILCIIRKNKLNPTALPLYQQGHAGVKSEIRTEALKNLTYFHSGGVFEKAWSELLRSGDIKYKKH